MSVSVLPPWMIGVDSDTVVSVGVPAPSVATLSIDFGDVVLPRRSTTVFCTNGGVLGRILKLSSRDIPIFNYR